METRKPLLKDADGEDVDEHMYRSMNGSLMYLTSSRLDIMFAVYVCARFQVNPKVSHLHAMKRIFRYLKGQPKLGLWYHKDSPFDLVAYTDSDYAGASLDRKSTIGVKNPVFYSKTKHIEIRHHFIRDSNEKKLIQMIKIHTGKNVANLLTKAFDLKVNAVRHNLLLLANVNVVEVVLGYCKGENCNGEVQLQALVDGKKVIITKTSVRRDLQLEDAEGIECLPNADIFEQLALMGYEKPSQKLTFYKAFFSPQWKFFIHTILQCLSAKSTAGRTLVALWPLHNLFATKPEISTFPKYIFEIFLDKQVGAMSTHDEIFVTPSHTKKVFGNMKRVGKGFSRAVTPLFPTMMVQAQQEQGEDEAAILRRMSLKHSNDPFSVVEALEIDSLKRRVKKLEKKQRSRTHGLRRLYKVGLSARVLSSKDEGLGEEDASKQGRKIHDIDADEDITLENVHDEDMFGVNDLEGDEIVVESEVADKDVNLSVHEVTLAQALAALKSTKV
ncbi:hypothetical protein Tco_1516164 [Tanacetum coccineum]